MINDGPFRLQANSLKNQIEEISEEHELQDEIKTPEIS